MRKQFLIHKLGGIYMAVNITGVGIKAQTVPTNQFTSWGLLEKHFADLGATKEALEYAKDQIEKNGTASLLI